MNAAIDHQPTRLDEILQDFRRAVTARQIVKDARARRQGRPQRTICAVGKCCFCHYRFEPEEGPECPSCGAVSRFSV